MELFIIIGGVGIPLLAWGGYSLFKDWLKERKERKRVAAWT